MELEVSQFSSSICDLFRAIRQLCFPIHFFCSMTFLDINCFSSSLPIPLLYSTILYYNSKNQSMTENTRMTIGVLALQGAFREHIDHLLSLKSTTHPNLSVVEVRDSASLSACDGLILPGGESTAMALVGSTSSIFSDLQAFVHVQRKPVWGTCAGCILLSDRVDHQKNGGQGLIGGIPIETARNHFGRQTQSFEVDLDVDGVGKLHAVFIRAPAILKTLSDDVKVLARCKDVVVAVQYGNRLATAFHPELVATDHRFHAFFANLVAHSLSSSCSS